jgi:hypothetical protein
MAYLNDEDRKRAFKFYTKIVLAIVLFILLVILSLMAGCPAYNVWNSEMNGKAQLSEAEYGKQVQVREAEANLEAERLNAESEIVRAQGAADAIDIEGGKITDSYIKYLWVKKLSLADTSVIYIPTEEGGIPTLTQPINPSKEQE